MKCCIRPAMEAVVLITGSSADNSLHEEWLRWKMIVRTLCILATLCNCFPYSTCHMKIRRLCLFWSKLIVTMTILGEWGPVRKATQIRHFPSYSTAVKAVHWDFGEVQLPLGCKRRRSPRWSQSCGHISAPLFLAIDKIYRFLTGLDDMRRFRCSIGGLWFLQHLIQALSVPSMHHSYVMQLGFNRLPF